MATKKITVPIEVTGRETVEKTLNAFSSLRNEIKEARAELLKYEVGTEAFDQAQKRVAALADKMGDLSDATKIQGTGIEKLGASFNLFRESLSTGDVDKFKLSMQGLGQSLKALPLLALISGLTYLITNFDEVIEKVEQFNTLLGFNGAASRKVIESLTKEAEAIKKRYDFEIQMAEASGQDVAKVEREKNDMLLDNLKQREVEYRKLIRINGELNDADLKKFKEVQDEILATEQHITIELAKEQHKRAENSKAFLKDSNKQIEDLNIEQMSSDEQREIAAAQLRTERAKQQVEEARQKTQTDMEENLKADDVTRELEESLQVELRNIRDKFAQQRLDQELALRKVRHDRQEMDAAAEKASIEQITSFKKDAAKQEQLITDEMDAASTKRVSAIIVAERQGQQRTLAGRLNLLAKERDANLQQVGNDALSAKAREEIWTNYHQKVLAMTVEQIKKTAQSVSSVAGQLNSMISQLGAIQQENQNQRLQALHTANANASADFEYNKEVRLQSIEDERIRTLNSINDQYAGILSGEQLSSDQRQEIEAQYHAARQAAETKAVIAKQKQENAAAKQKYALDLAQYNAENEVRKKGFLQQQKMQVATTIMNTIMGSVAAFTGMIAAIPGPYGIVAGGLAAAAVAAMGAVQVAQIRKQQFDAGTPPKPPVLPAIQTEQDELSGGGAGGSSTPNRATLFSTGASQHQVATGSGEAIKAYVVSTEITTQQQLDATIKSRNTY